MRDDLRSVIIGRSVIERDMEDDRFIDIISSELFPETRGEKRNSLTVGNKFGLYIELEGIGGNGGEKSARKGVKDVPNQVQPRS